MISRRESLLRAMLFFAASLAPSLVAAQTIDTRSSATVPQGGYAFGPGQYTTGGEYFTAPGALGDVIRLDDFTLYTYQYSPQNTSFSFVAALQGYNLATGSTTGPDLYTSSAVYGPGYTGTNVSTAETFMPGVLLNGGQMYIALLRGVSGVGAITGSSAAPVDLSSQGAYLTCCGGSQFYPRTDLPFVAHFTTISTAPTVAPEPASFTLLATGLVGIFGAARRRRRRNSEVM